MLPYEEYKRLNGLLAQTDYNEVSTLITKREKIPPVSPSFLQITNITSRCGIQVTTEQIIMYDVLRGRISPSDETDIPACRMCDQELVREVLRATEGNGDGSKYQKITQKYPNIFR